MLNIVERTILQASALSGTIVVTSDIAPKALFGRIVPSDTKFEDCPTQYTFKKDTHDVPFYFHDRAKKYHLNESGTTSEAVVEDVLNSFEDTSFCLMQPTSPIRDTMDLHKAERMFQSDRYPAVISLNEQYQPNGSFYFVRVKDFQEQGNIYVKGAAFYVLKGRANIDINYGHDFRIAQAANENRIFGEEGP
jgi:hypothetical protein